jgi:hypothetical protein
VVVEALERHGADRETAVLKDAVCQACYTAAVALTLTAAEPERPRDALESVFVRLAAQA